MGSDAGRRTDEFRRVHDTLQALPVFQDLTATIDHTEERVFCDVYKDARLVADQITDTAHQRSTTGQHDASIDDVGSQLRWGALQGALHRLNDHVEGLGNRFSKIACSQIDRTRQAGEEMQATYIH